MVADRPDAAGTAGIEQNGREQDGRGRARSAGRWAGDGAPEGDASYRQGQHVAATMAVRVATGMPSRSNSDAAMPTSSVPG